MNKNRNSSFIFLAFAFSLTLLLTACNRPAVVSPAPTENEPEISPLPAGEQSPAVQAALDLSNPGESGIFLFYDDFQDGQADNWETTGSWNVEQNGDVYVFGATSQGGAWVPSGHSWANYLFHAGVRLESGSLFLSMNLTQAGRYLLRLDQDAVYLIKEQPAENFTVLTQTGPVSMSTGHSVLIAGQDGHIQVYVDEQLWIDYVDAAPLTAGTVGVSSLEGSRVAVDNIFVLQLNGALPTGEVAAPPPAAVEPISPEVVAEEAAELPLSDIEDEQPPEVVEQGALPDLVAARVVFEPEPVVQGQPFQVVFYVNNEGNAPAGAFTVRMHFHAATGLPDCNMDFPGLAAGETGLGFCNLTTNANTGTSPTEFTVDVEGEIGEADENNNLATPTLTIAAADDHGGEEGGGPLSSPVGCSAEPLSANEIRIDWNVPGDLDGHEGFRAYQGVDSLELEMANPQLRSVVIGNLAPNTQYHFDVRAYNAAIESAPDACFVDVTTLQ